VTIKVHYPGGSRTLVTDEFDGDRDLADLLRRADLPLNTRCGRQGLCDGCLVELISGTLVETATGSIVDAMSAAVPVRACQFCTRSDQSIEIRIPARSLLAHEAQVVESFCCNVTSAFEPLWQNVSIARGEVEPSTLTADLLCRVVEQRLQKALPIHGSDELDAVSPAELDTIALCVDYCGEFWKLSRNPQSPGLTAYGLAVDVGTTTVVALLVDLATGEVLQSASALNAQTYLGDNVLTRINLCFDDKSRIGELRAAAIDNTLVPLVDELLESADARREQIAVCTVAGNTTMLHLLAGVDPSSMGAAPFTPQFLEHRMLAVEELQPSAKLPRETTSPTHGNSGADSRPIVHLLPGAAAYVGGDITAGVFSSGMAYRRRPTMLVDIGTNGEIVLRHGDHLVGCATAAGPAFEGAGLTCGVRAGDGAISHIRLEGDPAAARIEVIGGGRPIGLCGTAYVDFVSEARRCGLIGTTGRLTDQGLANPLVRPLKKGRGFQIAEGRGKEALLVSEGDIASLLQAKAAIAAGISCLLARFGFEPQDIATLYLSGGFGFHMDIDHLIGCGLLPGFAREQVEVMGNTSLAGAYLALMDAGALEEIKRIAARMEVVELNLEPEFTSRYIDGLWLP
jgi:uncharacterized 2Fe-2S/4Fe-4S cluster protein (DUF4445 family)